MNTMILVFGFRAMTAAIPAGHGPQSALLADGLKVPLTKQARGARAPTVSRTVSPPPRRAQTVDEEIVDLGEQYTTVNRAEERFAAIKAGAAHANVLWPPHRLVEGGAMPDAPPLLPAPSMPGLRTVASR